MTRRLLLTFPFALRLRADAAQEVWDLFSKMASALSEGNAASFLSFFDAKMPGLQLLETYVKALLDSAEVQSSISLLRDEGDDQARSVELDWFMQVVERQDTAALTRRRERVTCRVARGGRKWRVVSLQPVVFFEPPKPSSLR